MCNICNNHNCSSCNQTYHQETHICSECNTEQVCDECAVKDLSTDCSIYKGDDIVCGQTVIVKTNTILSDALEDITSWACNRFSEVENNFVLKNVGSGVGIYKGISLIGEKELRTLISTDNSVLITQTNAIDEIDFKVTPTAPTQINAGTNVTVTGNGSSTAPFIVSSNDTLYSAMNLGNGEKIFNDLSSTATNFKFKTVNSESLILSNDSSNNILNIELPNIFEGKNYYVNNNYAGAKQTGTQSKPFTTLKRAIDIVLNRAFQNNSNVWIESPNPTINGGNAYNKWDSRGFVFSKIVIQTDTEIDENLAIVGVEYNLESEQNSIIQVLPLSNLPYIFDTSILANNIPKTALDAGGNPNALLYESFTKITGKGRIINASNQRKGYIKNVAYNNGTLLEQNDIYFYIGDTNSKLQFGMDINPNISYIPLTDELGNPIIRESVNMTGYQQTFLPQYGCIEVHNANSQFNESLIISGDIQIIAYEQNLFYLKNGGTIYGDNGSIQILRSYQHINFDSIIPQIAGVDIKRYTPSRFVHDFYLENGSNINYSGLIFSQANAGANQGGTDSFACLVNNTPNITKSNFFKISNAEINNLLYNHFVKQVLNNALIDYQHNQIDLINIKFRSNTYDSIFSFITTTNTLWNRAFSYNIFNSYIQSLSVETSGFRKPLLDSNPSLYFLFGNIQTFNGYINKEIPTYSNNINALNDNYPKGGYYKTFTGELRIVI